MEKIVAPQMEKLYLYFSVLIPAILYPLGINSFMSFFFSGPFDIYSQYYSERDSRSIAWKLPTSYVIGTWLTIVLAISYLLIGPITSWVAVMCLQSIDAICYSQRLRYFLSGSTTFSVANGYKRIRSFEFTNHKSLESINLPDSIKSIEEQAFRNCTSLKSIKLPYNKDLRIERNALDGCTSLQCIQLPDTHVVLRESALRGCTSLRVIVTLNNYDWEMIGVDTNKTAILTYSQYLEQYHASIIANLNMQNLTHREAYQVCKMIEDQNYIPNLIPFKNRSISQVYDLFNKLNRNIGVINKIIPSIFYENVSFEPNHPLNEYLTMSDHWNLCNGAQQVNISKQTHEMKSLDLLPKKESKHQSSELSNYDEIQTIIRRPARYNAIENTHGPRQG